MPLQDTLQDIVAWMPDLPYGLLLAVVATLGYVFGRSQKQLSDSPVLKTKREIERAQAVAQELEKIASHVRKNLAKHHACVARFKERVSDLTASHDSEAWKKLCEEADEFLKPTIRLANEIAQAYDELRQQTTHLMAFTEVRTDPLTGVRNRRALDEVLDGLLAMKLRYDQDFSLVILDLDHFKQVNDEQGHLVGDRVLRAFANLLTETVRETDVVTRYGGEEFVVIMPRTSLDDACNFCERLRSTVEQSKLDEMRVTVSGGVAMAFDSEEAESLLKRADEALYHAKSAGRNRIYRHTGDHIEPISTQQPANEASPIGV